MYTTLITGQATVGAAASLATLRAQLTALTFASSLLSAAEKLRSNHSIHECEDIGRLKRWLVNVGLELERRGLEREKAVVELGASASDTTCELANCPAPTCYATGVQRERLLNLLHRLPVTRQQKTRVLLNINRLTYAEARALLAGLEASILPPDDRPAGRGDRKAAALFSPSSTLSYADLLVQRF